MLWDVCFDDRVAALRLCLGIPGGRRHGAGNRWTTNDSYCSALRKAVICSQWRRREQLWALLNWPAYRWEGSDVLWLWPRSFAAGCIGDDPHIGSRPWLNKLDSQAFWFCWLPFCSLPARHPLTTQSPDRQPRNLLQLSPEKRCPRINATVRARWDPATCGGNWNVKADKSRACPRFNPSTV